MYEKDPGNHPGVFEAKTILFNLWKLQIQFGQWVTESVLKSDYSISN